MPLEAAKLQHTALPSESTIHVNGRMWLGPEVRIVADATVVLYLS
jgi:hypothetical protein